MFYLCHQIYTCGPSPVDAIKQGDTNVPYDTGFIFSEVNADYVMWEGSKVLSVDTKR